ncbi:hypothetical protein ACN47E_003397 [Coniothyrium glycines]
MLALKSRSNTFTPGDANFTFVSADLSANRPPKQTVIPSQTHACPSDRAYWGKSNFISSSGCGQHSLELDTTGFDMSSKRKRHSSSFVARKTQRTRFPNDTFNITSADETEIDTNHGSQSSTTNDSSTYAPDIASTNTKSSEILLLEPTLSSESSASTSNHNAVDSGPLQLTPWSVASLGLATPDTCKAYSHGGIFTSPSTVNGV